MLSVAKRPILIAGLGLLWAGACEEFVRLAERLGAPVLTTPKCRGAIPEDHALRAGCIIGGLIERNLVGASDLILTVGLDAVELQPKAWPYRIPLLALASTPTRSCRPAWRSSPTSSRCCRGLPSRHQQAAAGASGPHASSASRCARSSTR